MSKMIFIWISFLFLQLCIVIDAREDGNYHEDMPSYSSPKPSTEQYPIDKLLEDLAERSKEITSKNKNLKLPLPETNDPLAQIINQLAASPGLKNVSAYFKEHDVGPAFNWIGDVASKVHISKVAACAVGCGSHTINQGDKIYFQSPKYPAMYPKNYKCEWNFNCASENANVELNCDDYFELQKNPQCHTDYIEMFDKFGPIGRNCGKDAPKGLTSSTDYLGVVFKTNWDKIRRAGFSCNVICKNSTITNIISPRGKRAVHPKLKEVNLLTEVNKIDSDLKPDGPLSSEVGYSQVARAEAVECGDYSVNPGEKIYFHSKNYPNKYPKNYKCVWKFNCTLENTVMELNCDDHFELQKNPICSTDFIQTFDKSGSIKKNCGKDAPKALASYSNFMKVVFRTNGDKIQRAGFSCNVICQGIATTTKPIENPTPPTAPNSPTTEDEPPTTKADPSTKKADSPTTPTEPQAKAESLTTKDTPPSAATTPENPPTVLSALLQGRKHVIEPSKTYYFESVNCTRNYRGNCIWRFKCSARSSMIEVDCPEFNVGSDDDDECAKAFVKVKGGRFGRRRLGTFCGSKGPTNLVSYHHVLKFIFKSGQEENNSGFRCSVRCTSIETSSSGGSSNGYDIAVESGLPVNT